MLLIRFLNLLPLGLKDYESVAWRLLKCSGKETNGKRSTFHCWSKWGKAFICIISSYMYMYHCYLQMSITDIRILPGESCPLNYFNFLFTKLNETWNMHVQCVSSHNSWGYVCMFNEPSTTSVHVQCKLRKCSVIDVYTLLIIGRKCLVFSLRLEWTMSFICLRRRTRSHLAGWTSK